jgi:ABC-type phosphate transport system substrate-binding protein
MPLKPEQLSKDGLVQFPTVMGGDVPVVNLEGVKSGDLKLDGDTLAKIFLGEIKTWDAPAIKKLNPNAKLTSQAIVVVHRSDGSGTTFIWTAISPRSAPIGSRKSAPIRRSNGRPALAQKATKASRTTSPIPKVRSATSSMPTPSRII